jgi:hypothetical protein
MTFSGSAQRLLGLAVWAAGMTKQVGARTADARLLAMATRLFSDFEELPVRTVFQAIGAARLELRERQQGIPTADDIEALARPRLEDAVAHRPTR